MITNKLESGDYSTSFNKFVFDKIAEHSVCLDVGCWTGNLGKALIKDKQCTIDGIDFRADVLSIAKKNGYRNTYLINLNAETLDLSEIQAKYDYIIFADVLEHLINPAVLLYEVKAFLHKSGRVVISLPNVAFILNRLFLLLGRWEYKEFGTLDKTHLRFYTPQSGSKMVSSAGFSVVENIPYTQFSILRYFNPFVKLIPTLLGYQFLIIAKATDK